MARTSSYAKFLQPTEYPAVQLPGFVLGGDYGDITRNILQQELSQAQLDNNALQQQANELAIQQRRREQDYQQSLSQTLTPDMSMRDAYDKAAKTALEYGQADDFVRLRNAQLQDEERERNRRIEALRLAPQLAAAGLGDEGVKLLSEVGVDAPSGFIEANQRLIRGPKGLLQIRDEMGNLVTIREPQASSGGSGGGKEIMGRILTGPGGEQVRVTTKDDYNKYFQRGYNEVDPEALAFAEAIKPEQKTGGSSAFGSVLEAVTGKSAQEQAIPVRRKKQ